MNKQHIFNSSDLINRLLTLEKQKRYGEMYQIVYDKIVNNVDEVITDPWPIDQKVRTIEKTIRHFTSTEEYEKCAELLSILNRMKEAVNI